MAVRREAVRLEVEDHFTRDILRAAAAAQTLRGSLDSLSGSAVQSARSVSRTEREVDGLATTSKKTGSEVDKLSGRMRILADVAAIVGPALVPIGALAIPALTGLTAQVGFAVLGLGSLIIASQGVGDALKAVNEAALEPTAANLQKAQDAMGQLGPAAQAFVNRFQQLRPTLRMIREAAASGWFPGLVDAMDSLDRLGPRVASIIQKISQTGGRLVAEGARALEGPEWSDFLSFVELNAPQALNELGRTVGNLVKGLANLWIAFDPVNDDFSTWLLKQARAFAEWSDGVSQTQGFQDFINYISENGPRVAEALGAVGNGVVQVIEAVAPLGGPSLKIIEVFGDAIAAIADSDIGTPLLAGVAALTLYTRGLQLATAMQSKLFGTAASDKFAAAGAFGFTRTLAKDVRAATPSLRQFGQVTTYLGQSTRYASESTLAARAAVRTFSAQAARAAAPVAGLALASSGAADSIGLTNTASLALVGSLAGPWGVAIGAAVGGIKDLDAATRGFSDTVADVEKNISAGKFRDAAEQLAQLKAQAKDSNEISGLGDALDDVGKGLERVFTGDIGFLFGADEDKIRSLTMALNGAKRAAADQAAFDALAERYGTAGEKAAVAARQTGRLKTAIASLNAIVDQQAAWDAYAASIDNVTDSVKENGRTLNSNTAAGRANRQSIRELVTSGQQYADTLSGMSRVRFLQSLLADFDTAVAKAGGATKATRDLRAELAGELKALKIDINTAEVKNARDKLAGLEDLMGDIDGTTAKPKVDLNKKSFDAKGTYVENYLTMITGKGAKPKVTLEGVPAVEAALGRLTRPRTVTITANTNANIADAYTNRAKKAFGGAVFGRGTETSDSIPALLSHNEHVWSAAEVRGAGGHAQVERMRARARAGAIPTFARGGAVKGPRSVGALEFAGLPALDFATMGLKSLGVALRDSKRALEKETSQREAVVDKMSDLRSSVVSRSMSELFGETNPWGPGGTPADAVRTLNADSAQAKRLKAEIAKLKAKGLDGPALDELLAKADDQTISAYANSSASALRAFELAFERRAALTASVGSYASQAAYGAELRLQTRETKAVGVYVQRVEKAIHAEALAARRAAKRGARAGSRSRKRG